MDLTTPSVKHPGLEEVQWKFEQWRRDRDKREAIPKALWEAAASLYPAFSLNCISRTLRLNYNRLKHYIHEQSMDSSMPTQTKFIEMDLSSPVPAQQYNVEMEHRNGDRMTVQGMNSQDMIELAQIFWQRP